LRRSWRDAGAEDTARRQQDTAGLVTMASMMGGWLVVVSCKRRAAKWRQIRTVQNTIEKKGINCLAVEWRGMDGAPALGNRACLVVAIGSAVHLLHTRVTAVWSRDGINFFSAVDGSCHVQASIFGLACLSWASPPRPITAGPSKRLHIAVLPGRVDPPVGSGDVAPGTGALREQEMLYPNEQIY
jgi:hypothetical protein